MDFAALIFAAVALGLASGAAISAVWLGDRLTVAERRIDLAARIGMRLGLEIDQLAATVHDLDIPCDEVIADIANEQIDFYDADISAKLAETAGHCSCASVDQDPTESGYDCECDNCRAAWGLRRVGPE